MRILDLMHTLALGIAFKDMIGMLPVEGRNLFKRHMNNGFNQLEYLTKRVEQQIKDVSPEDTHERLDIYLDDIAATSSEVLREYCLAKDKKRMLAIMKMENAGLIKEEK